MEKFKFLKLKIKKYNWAQLGLELLVVFLGVSSGFILNNWREEKQDRQVEQNYIQRFIEDVGENIIELENLTKEDSLWLESMKVNILSLKDDKMNKDSADVMMKKVIEILKMEARSGTYEDITNSGNLNLILNLELRRDIVDYQLDVKGVEFVDEYFYQFFKDHIIPFVFAEFDLLEGKIKDEKVYKTISFKNVITGYYSMVQQRKEAYEELLIKSRDLENLLKLSVASIE